MLHGWDKLHQHERRNILNGIRDGAIYNSPYHAEFSPTDACNYECFFCNSAFVDRSKRLPWDLLERTLRDLIAGGLKSIRLAGGGEPLIYPEVENILDLCLENRIGISNITTNAFKLSPKIAEKILKLDTTEIIVSFNDVDPERYALTNGTTERAFHVVQDNIRYLLDQRLRLGLTRPKIVQQFFLWKGNYEQIERAYDMAVELGVDNIYIRDMYGIAPEKVMNDAELHIAGENMKRLIERDKERGILIVGFSNERILQEQKTHGDQYGDHVDGSRRVPLWRSEHPTRSEYCYIAWYSTVIRGNGEVFPCCMLSATPGYTPLGNIKKTPFMEIWNGANYAKLRSELREFAMNEGRFDSGKEHCFTYEFCSMRDACPFVKSLASPEFYTEVLGELEGERRKPANRIRTLAEALSTSTLH